MANLRKETSRHDWQRQTQRTPYGDRKVWVCFNCRAFVVGEDPDRPVAGCLTEIKVKSVGQARQKDYLEQEMRLRSEQDTVERQLLGDVPDLVMVPMDRDRFERLREQRED